MKRLLSILAVALLALISAQAQTHVQTANNNANSATSNSKAFGSNTTAGNRLWAFVAFSADNTATATISDTSNTWVTMSGPDNQTLTGNQFRMYAFCVKSAVGGADTVKATFSASRWSILIISEWSGMKSTACGDQKSFAAAGATSATAFDSGASPTTSQASEVLFGIAANLWNSAGGWTPGTITPGTYTVPTNGNADSSGNGQYEIFEYLIVSATGAYHATGTTANAGANAGYIITDEAAGGSVVAQGFNKQRKLEQMEQ